MFVNKVTPGFVISSFRPVKTARVFRFRLLQWLMFAVFAGLALAQAPSGLTVVSATNVKVQLTWNGTGTSYIVQRAAVGGAFGAIATVSATSFTDTPIDPYGDYTYQIVSAASSSQVSNQVTVGAPPSGISVAAPAPIIGSTPSPGYGFNTTLALDGNGDPAFGFLWADPNNKQDYTQTQLMFRSWNRAQAKWNPVVSIAVVGDVSTGGHASTSLAYDSATNTWALACEDSTDSVRLYTSKDGGVTWGLKRTFSGYVSSPSLGAAGGIFYMVFNVGGQGLTYVTGAKGADPSTYQTVIAPVPAGMSIARTDISPSLAVDSAGNPAVAYYANDSSGTGNTMLFYWRPTTGAAPVKVLTTDDTVASTSYVRMVFHNLNPRIAFGAEVKTAPSGAHVFFVRSDNGGTTWQSPAVIPQDGESGADYPFDIATTSQDAAAIAYGVNGSVGGGACGNPKLARSSNLVNWTVCSAPNTNSFNLYPDSIQLAFGGNDKLLLFWFNVGSSQADTGVMLYREPPDNQSTVPVMANLLDAESSRATVVAGSWAAIYGSNLSGTTRIWNTQDFNSGSALPTALSGVSVSFNGLPAPVYFISPTQLDVQVPANISGSVSVAVTANGSTSAVFKTTVVTNAPSLFYYAGGTKIYPAAVFPDGILVGDPTQTGVSSRKAKPGDTLILFVNGLASSPSGNIISSPIAYSSPVTVTIGTTSFTAAYAGLVAAGEFQLNAVIPTSLTPGEYPITVTVQGQTSPNNVMLPVGP